MIEICRESKVLKERDILIEYSGFISREILNKLKPFGK